MTEKTVILRHHLEIPNANVIEDFFLSTTGLAKQAATRVFSLSNMAQKSSRVWMLSKHRSSTSDRIQSIIVPKSIL